MKIAVCFSGQIRRGSVECSSNILRYIGELLPYCDFFVHTWDIVSLGTGFMCRTDKSDPLHNKWFDTARADLDNIYDFAKVYKPRSMQVEEYNLQPTKSLWGGRRYDPVANQWHVSMWRSMYESNKLKMEYAFKNNINYDYTIRIRPDIVFDSSKSLSKDISEIKDDNSLLFGDPWCIYPKTIKTRIEDILWISSTSVMDQVCSYYKYYSDTVLNIDDSNSREYRDWQYHCATWIINVLHLDFYPISNSTFRVYNILDLEEKCDPLNPGFGNPPGAFKFK